MKNRKFRFLTTALLILIVICVTALTGCGEKKVSDIAITESGTPRLTYVLGQELDLSHGTLTALIGGEQTSVPLNAEGVTVSGYNKDQLGKQTLTVTYKDKTTTFEVTVVARMVAENYEAEYFVNDEFDTSKGRLRITKDDASVVTVNLSSPNVKIKSFDSSAAGDVTVTVAYSGASGDSYETSFAVKVYNVGEVSFTQPSKSAYSSHETEMSYAGGYFTVKAEGSSTLSKFVNITDDMQQGFNPSAATIENRNNPLSQTVTFTYAGKSFDFPITVIYSGISIINDSKELLDGIDWTDESVTVSDVQGQAALDAVTEYLKLTQAKKNLIGKSTLEMIVRPAAQYITKLYKSEAKRFEDSFIVTDDASVLLVGKSYEQMKLDVAKLKDSTDLFNVYGDTLRQMKEEFKDMTMSGDVTVGDYIVITPAEEISNCVKVFEFLMSLHDELKEVPEDWEVENLEAYSNNIETAVQLFKSRGFIGPNYNYVFKVIQNWRAENDYFDIIYSYYYYLANDGHEFIQTDLWQQLPMPGRLQDWYISLYNAVWEAQYMVYNASGTAYLHDTTNFMYYYFDTMRIAAEIKNGTNEFYKGIYLLLNGDRIMDENIRRVNGGYLAHVGGSIDSDEFLALWGNYMQLVELGTKGDINFDEHQEKFEATFEALTNLSPTEVFGFACSLKYLYEQSGGSFYAFDFSETANNQFVYMLANYYIAKLPESIRPAFGKLMIAMESYSSYCVFGAEASGLADFKEAMDGIDAILKSGISDADREAFDTMLGKCYNKYLDIYNALESAPTLSADAEAKLGEFEATLKDFVEVVNYIADENNEESARNSAIILLFSLYEKAKDIHDGLIASAEPNLLTTLYTKNYEFGEVQTTLDITFYNARNIFVTYAFSSTFRQSDAEGNMIETIVWDLYKQSEIEDFLSMASDVILAGFDTSKLPSDTTVDAVLAAFDALEQREKGIFYMLGVQLYYDGLEAFYHSEFEGDDNGKTLATELLEAHYACFLYSVIKNDETLEYLTAQMSEATELFNGYTDTEKRDGYFGQMYNGCVEKYSSLTATEQPAS